MAKKYKYSYYVFDTKEDYDLFLELIELHGFTGKYDGASGRRKSPDGAQSEKTDNSLSANFAGFRKNERESLENNKTRKFFS